MANPSSSYEPTVVVSREPFRHDGVPSPISRSASPVPRAGDTATMVAFRKARDTFRKSLSEKDVKCIMIPTGPEDVVNEIEKWHERHLESKVAASVRFGLDQLKRFNASLDMLAQGTRSPGCLLWGSIKFVLTIVQDAVQAYEQLCKALIRMIDCLPRVEIYAEAFLKSRLVADCVNAFYISAIRFWARACKFHRRRRLWKSLHIIWNNFDTEFGTLEADLVRNRDRVERAALAEYIGDSRAANLNQRFVNSELLEAQISTRRKEITKWLAPAAYDVEYFSNDLATARALRHPKTCVWILDKPELIQLCDTCHGPERSLLWIYANPGTGKTILSSFLIDHFASVKSSPLQGNVFYFFCKNTDVDKNTSTVVVRSLLYQVYKSVKDPKASRSLNDDLGVALDQSGQQSAVNFTVLWQLFSAHVRGLAPATIILDALDECKDPSRLIDGLKELSTMRSIKVIVTSRKDLHLHNELNNVSSSEILPEDINADIAAFVEAKVEASSQISHPLVRDLVITKLCNAHDGMFLWVYLVLKELKSCISVVQVQDALSKLPTGLDGIYERILYRLQTTLTRSSFDLCLKILTWVVSAVRPLGIHEVKHALTLHYEMDGDILLTDDRSFPFSDRDVELVCGSLVTIRKGVLQVIHLTVKEFLRSPQGKNGSTYNSLLVDPDYGSLQLTLVCLRCIADSAEPLVDLESKSPQIDWAVDLDALRRCQARAPLLEYAIFSWLAHLIDCKLDEILKVTSIFEKTFSSLTTFSWVEKCMTLQPDSSLRLSVGISEVYDWLHDPNHGLPVQQEASLQFLAGWCTAMSSVFEGYCAVLSRRPWQIYIIDLHDIFNDDPSLRKMWQKCGTSPLREKDLRLNVYQNPQPQQKRPKPHLQLQKGFHTGDAGPDPVFLVHDEARNLYIWGEIWIRRNNHCIYIQHEKTGQRLPPAEDLSLEVGQTWRLVDMELSPNGEYLVLTYFIDLVSDSEVRGLTVAWRIVKDLSFKRRMNSEPWARVIFSHYSTFAPFAHCSRAIIFTDNHCCFTPIGTLDLLTMTRRGLPDNVNKCHFSGLCYGYSGQYLLVSTVHNPYDSTSIQAKRFDLSDPSHSDDFCWEDKRRRLADVSPSGRYLVLGGVDSSPEEALYLYDTNLNVNLELLLHEPLDYREGKFHFSKDESRLIAFLIDRFRGLTVIIWDCLVTAPRLTSYAKLDIDQWTHPHQIHIHKAATSAVIVTRTRYIQRVELGDHIELIDPSDLIDGYPHMVSTVSKDCSHCALLSYGRNGGKVQIIDLTSPNAPARSFDLRWSQSDISEAIDKGLSLPISISPDLSVLVINAEVFDLTATIDSRGSSKNLTLTSFTMEAVPALLRPYLHQLDCRTLKCRISPCNSYVLYEGRGDQWGDWSRYSPVIFLFRINIKEMKSVRLELMLPEHPSSVEASFHPSLPLMAISYGRRRTTESEDNLRTPPELCLAIFQLSDLTMKILELGKDQLTKVMGEHWRAVGWLPRLLFSDCGTFVYLENRAERKDWWFQKIDRISSSPVPARCIWRQLSLDNSITFLYGGDHTSVTLELIKFDDNGFWAGNGPTVGLEDITSYSSHLVDAERFLLLGAHDDEKMRMLIVPRDGTTPMIKTLSLTFAEARSRLEKEWQRLHVEAQDQEPGMVTETGND